MRKRAQQIIRPEEPSSSAITSDSDLLRNWSCLEIRHHLIGNKMYGPGILGHFCTWNVPVLTVSSLTFASTVVMKRP